MYTVPYVVEYIVVILEAILHIVQTCKSNVVTHIVVSVMVVHNIEYGWDGRDRRGKYTFTRVLYITDIFFNFKYNRKVIKLFDIEARSHFTHHVNPNIKIQNFFKLNTKIRKIHVITHEIKIFFLSQEKYIYMW